MPLGPSIEKNIRDLKETHPDWPHPRVVAAALSAACRAGNEKACRENEKTA